MPLHPTKYKCMDRVRVVDRDDVPAELRGCVGDVSEVRYSLAPDPPIEYPYRVWLYGKGENYFKEEWLEPMANDTTRSQAT